MLRLVTLICLVTAFAPAAWTQTTGAIEGRVTDQQGVPLPGVTVTASSPSLQGLQVSSSGASGAFRLPLLPPGTYVVRFALSGFSPLEHNDVSVGLGRSVTLYVKMPAAFAEEVTVTGAPPAVDVSSTEVGANLTKDFFLSLPIQRSYTSVLRVAPGTSDDAVGTMVYGSSGAENSYYIDGLNVTEINRGRASKELNFEFIQEVQVKTGGYQAEFGRSTGGVVNVITRSGGNAFHGDVFGYYFGDALQADPRPEIAVYKREYAGSAFETAFTESDVGVDLGGPLLRDKLWFFAAYDRVSHDADLQVSKDFSPYGGPSEGTVYVQSRRRDLWAAKLTWRLGQAHSIVASAFGDPTTQDGPVRPLNGEEMTFLGTRETGGNDGLVRWDGVLGESVVASAQVSRHTDRDVMSGPGAEIPRVVDLTTPLYFWTDEAHRSGGFGGWFDEKYTRDLYRADLSYYANDHEIEGGAEVEDISADYILHNSGGQNYSIGCAEDHLTEDGCAPEWTYFSHSLLLSGLPPGGPADPSIVDYIVDAYATKPKNVNDAAYLQDSWHLLPVLTLDLGLRWERQRIYDGQGTLQIDIADEWAPRLGFVWDFRGDGGSKLYGSWGRFYETIPMDPNVRNFSIYTRVSIVNRDPSSLICDARLATDPAFPGCRPIVPAVEPVDPAGVEGQYVDEAILGAKLEVAPDLVLGAKLIWRNLGRIVEDSLTADLSYYIGNPGRGVMTSAYDLGLYYSECPHGGHDCHCHGTPDCHRHAVVRPKRTFKGVELVVRKRFSDSWQLMASYLWSKLEGNYDGTYQASTNQLDPNLNSAFDVADFQVNNDGYLTNDRRHRLKVDASYRFPFGLDLGVSAYYRSGTPVTAMGYSDAYVNWELYLSQRGQWARTSPEYEVDLHLGYPFRVRGVEVNVLLDVFNLLDRQGETSRDMRYNLREINEVINDPNGAVLPPIPNGTPCTSTVSADDAVHCNSGFNTANDWQAPRSVRLGVRVTF